VEMFSAAVMLFLIMDPLGNLPVFMSILKNIDPKRRKLVLMRELTLALVIMLVFLFGGANILQLLNLDQESVSIAGGLILFLIALRMIFPEEGGVVGLAVGEEPLLVPMAVPLVAGPSSLAALILLANQEPDRMTDWTLALILAWLGSSLILMFSDFFHKVLGERALTALERLMGMILVMISVQMFLDGIVNFIATHLNLSLVGA